MGLVDQENTYNFAIDKLIKWKYEVFVIDKQNLTKNIYG